MTASLRDPVRQFEHSHASLTRRAVEIREMLRVEASTGWSPAARRKRLVEHLKALGNELLHHFAREEEGLFPFVRARLPAQSDAVDRLVEGHDVICGAILRLVHLVDGDLAVSTDVALRAISTHYERFELAYARHSQDEAALFDELGRTLNEGQRFELAEILRGL
jgi:iron-sulfur cluster repair protein YtfE (RIC family)